MAQCCSDQTCILRDDFESGAPLSATYATVTNVALTSGAGINASTGVRTSGGSYGELYTNVLDVSLRGALGQAQCYNNRDWGFGGKWKFNQFVNSGYWWAQLGKSGSFINYSFYIEDNPIGTGTFPADLVVYQSISSTEVVRVSQIIPDKTSFHTLEAKGRTATFNGNGDGELELRVNGVVVACLGNESYLAANNWTWDQVSVGIMGDFDCLYVTNGWYCGQAPLKADDPIIVIPDTEEIITSPCCGNAGPGGSSTTYDWTTPSITDDSPPPVTHAPGGANPSYTACATGGAGPTASDPTDAQSLASITDPLAYVELTLPDTTVLRLAQHPVATPGAAIRQGRLLQLGAVPQTLADLYGRLRSQTVSVVFEDTDRVFRGYAVDTTNRYLKGMPVLIYAESDTARRASTSPLVMGRYLVHGFKPLGQFQFQLDLIDPIFSRQSPTSLDRPVPAVAIGDVFPQASPELSNVPIPMYYGQYGDDDKWAENPKRVPVGIVPAIGPVGPAERYAGQNWDPYVICRFASKSIGSIFGSNEAASPGSVRWDLDDEGTKFLLPGNTGWNAVFSDSFRDITAPDGTVYRLTMIYVRGQGSKDHRENRSPISVNLCGIEATGDGTGTLITDADEVLRHFLNYVVFSQPTTGDWGAVPTDDGGVAVTNQASFTTVGTTHAARLTGGYPVAWAIRERRPAESYLREFQLGTGIRIGRSRQQLVVATLDDEPTLSGLTTFDHTSIIEGTFALEPSSDEVVNKLTYVYGPEAATRRWSGERQVMTDAGVVASYGDTYEQVDVELHPIRSAAVASDIMSRRLLRLRHEPMYGQFATDLRGAELTLGQLIRVTHEEGLGSSGWTDRVVMVTGTATDLQIGQMRTIVSFEDVHTIVASAADSTASAVGFHPIGTNGVDAFVIGSSSAGTAWRIGS